MPYIVIPCTYNPQEEAKFTMSFSCDGAITLEPLSPNKEWKHVMMEVRARPNCYAPFRQTISPYFSFHRANGQKKQPEDAKTTQPA